MSVAVCLNCQSPLQLDDSLVSPGNESSTVPIMSQVGVAVVENGHSMLPSQSGNLFDLICDSKSALSVSMCKECTEELLAGMDRQLAALEEECVTYRQLLDALKNDRSNKKFDVGAAQLTLNKLKMEESTLLAELTKLESEERQLTEELSRKRGELETIGGEEEHLWRTFRNNHRRLLDLDANEQSAEAQLSYARSQLDRLVKLNVINLSFHIWTDGQFGTINGFRLGRLPDCKVEWQEINAAWGQALLLLQVLTRRLDIELSDYELVPMASTSLIRCRDNGLELPLYGTGSFFKTSSALSRLDQAMVAFVECFSQLQKKKDFRLPHRMSRDGIEENKMIYSVKMQFNSEERWTKALKCLLINLKWTMGYTAILDPPP